ncbi:MAG: hypothetical protein AB1896_08850 [Thermodesulfobacteriota bacterium]
MTLNPPPPAVLTTLFPFEKVGKNRSAEVVNTDAGLKVITSKEAFAAEAVLPIEKALIAGSPVKDLPARIDVRAVGIAGYIGVGAATAEGVILDEARRYGSGEDREFTFSLYLPRLETCDCLVIRNCDETGEPARLEITGVDVTPRTWSGLNRFDDTLIALYDLRYLPVSYDVVGFLTAANAVRQENGLSRIHVVFIPEDQSGNNRRTPQYAGLVDEESIRWRREHVLYDLAALYPRVAGYTVAGSREEGLAWIRAAKYFFPNPWTFPSFLLGDMHRLAYRYVAATGGCDNIRAPEMGRRYVRQWLAVHGPGRRPVVVTLRQYAWEPERNSRESEWLAFARSLDPEKYLPVIVPDTDAAFLAPAPGAEGLAFFPEAAFLPGLRMALYEEAFLGLFEPAGPTVMAQHSPVCRYLVFPNQHQLSDEPTLNYWRRLGILYKSAISPHPYQKWVWDGFSSAVITREFSEMAERIE